MASRCPKCGRFTVNYDPRGRTERCFAIDCSWYQDNSTTSNNCKIVPSVNHLMKQPNQVIAIKPQIY
jgi:hypothetical protein